MENGLQILTEIRVQLIALRDNLNDAVVQLNQANPNDRRVPCATRRVREWRDTLMFADDPRRPGPC